MSLQALCERAYYRGHGRFQLRRWSDNRLLASSDQPIDDRPATYAGQWIICQRVVDFGRVVWISRNRIKL